MAAAVVVIGAEVVVVGTGVVVVVGLQKQYCRELTLCKFGAFSPSTPSPGLK
jgi:hypothetical protein